MDDEEISRDRGDRRLGPDLGRAEPILKFTPVEHQLQRADSNAQRGESEEIEHLAMRVPRFADEH
jgi:hypothetical protein